QDSAKLRGPLEENLDGRILRGEHRLRESPSHVPIGVFPSTKHDERIGGKAGPREISRIVRTIERTPLRRSLKHLLEDSAAHRKPFRIALKPIGMPNEHCNSAE